MLITVPEAAARTHRDPETVRRWIRSGKLRASKVGTQHVIEEEDLEAMLEEPRSVGVPDSWKRFESGRLQPDWVKAIHESRHGH